MSSRRGEGFRDDVDECVPWGGQTVDRGGVAWSDKTATFRVARVRLEAVEVGYG